MAAGWDTAGIAESLQMDKNFLSGKGYNLAKPESDDMLFPIILLSITVAVIRHLDSAADKEGVGYGTGISSTPVAAV